MTPVVVLCILLCAASADVSEPQEEMVRMMIKEEEQGLPEDLVPELIDAARFQPPESLQARYSCPDGWSYYSDFCYKFFNTYRTWYDAAIDCYQVGANLASTPSKLHYNFLYDLISAAGTRYAWLGGVKVQGVWVWKDEMPFSYDGWDEESSSSSAACVQMSSRYGWENLECTRQKAFICSKRAGC